MVRVVKGRVYDNSRREAAARETRRAVVDAAHGLFLEKGYGGTSLAEVAEAAGVSVQTVYAQLGSKRALLKEVLDVVIAGDHEPVPLRDRAEAEAFRAEPDPERKLRLVAALFIAVALRVEPVDRVMRSAAAVDLDVAEQVRLADQGRLTGMTEIARHLRNAGVLREDLTVAQAAQRLWALNGPALYRPLVVEQGLGPQEYEQWLGDLLIASLLPPASARPATAGGQKSGRKGVAARR
jgi:AcrR family transcriptional regulator